MRAQRVVTIILLSVCVVTGASAAVIPAIVTSPPEAEFSYTPSTPNPDDEITLDASASTDNGSIVSYEWDTNGDGEFSDYRDDADDGQTTTATFDSGGTYTVSLRVTDDQGNTDTISKTITVENPEPDASFSFSPSTPNPDDEITLDATGSSDPDGSIVSYEWDTNGDGEFSDYRDDADDGQTTTVTFDSGGTYTVSLRVTDNGGKTTTITKTITVENPEPNASFTFSPATPNPDDEITLDASGSSDPDGSIVSYKWDTNGDGEFSDYRDDADDGQTTTVSFDSGGTYTVRLRVTDNGGKTETITKTISVENPAPNASFSFSPATPNPDDTVTLDATGSSDPDGSIVSYEWDTNGDGEYSDYRDDADDGQTTTMIFESGGTYTVGLRVTDNGGKTETITKTITVENPAPNASFSFTPATPNPDDEITLDATGSSDPDGTIDSFKWDTNGDGEFSDYRDDADDGETTAVTFDGEGNYTVSLKVTDNGGKTRTITRTITVENPAPNASFSVSPTAPNPDDEITLDASGSSDPDGSIVSYEWDTNGDGEFSDYRDDADDGQTTTVSFSEEGNYTIRLRVTDNGGKSRTITKTITVKNPAPNASFVFSPSVPNPDDEITLDATNSTDPDGTITSYEWDTDGDREFSEVRDDADDGAVTTVTFGSGGNYTVTLQVTDNGGKSRTITKTVTVENPAPSASFTYATDLSGDLTASFDATNSSDPDGQIVSYAWFVDDDRVAEGTTPTIEFAGKGEYTIKLVVTDNGGKSTTVTRTVSVSERPTASAAVSSQTIGTGQPLRFSAVKSSDPDGSITTYRWQFSDGETFAGESGTRTFSDPGTYNVTLTVTDDTGGTDTVTRTIRVKVPPAVSVTWTPSEPADDALVTFTATANDTVETYEWDLDGDGTFETSGKTVEHRFPDGGSKTVTLRATGPSGVANITERTVQVRRVQPTANLSWSPQVPRAGQDVVFRANSSDGIAKYEWDFDNDGEIEASGSKVTHQFAQNGKQAVVLYVTDEFGDEAKRSRIITIRESASFSLTADRSEVTEGETVIVRFAASNKLPDKPISVKLNLNLPGTGVSIAGVNGGELAGRSSTRFITVDPGSDRGFQVRLSFASPRDYNISATAVYYIGSPESGERRTTEVGPIEVTVPASTASPTVTNSESPGFGVALAVAVLLALAGVARVRSE